MGWEEYEEQCGGRVPPNGFATFDYETWRDANKPVIGACYSVEHVRVYYTGKRRNYIDKARSRVRIHRAWGWAPEVPQMLSMMAATVPYRQYNPTSKKMEAGVPDFFAHNATFDITALFSTLYPEYSTPLMAMATIEDDDRWKCLLAGSKVLHLQTEVGGGTIIDIRDSQRLLTIPLSGVGQALGFPKGETPEKFTNANHPDYGNPDSITADDINYCIRDCEVLHRGLSQLWSTTRELGAVGRKWDLTIGTMGYKMLALGPDMKQYVSKNGNKKPRMRVEKEHLDLECRKAFVGGRVQVFNSDVIREKSAGIDANSHYPSVLTDENNRYPDFRTMVSMSALPVDDKWEEQEGAVHVRWKRPADDYVGMFAGLNPQTGTLDWTLWEGERWITLAEYRKAKSMGYGLELSPDPESGRYGVICPTMEENPFGTVKQWFDKRLEYKKDGDPREQTLKILLNAAGFGKFAEQRRDSRWTTEFSHTSLGYEASGYEFDPVCEEDGIMYGWSTGPVERVDNSAYVLAAYITAYARIRLYEVLHCIPQDCLLYCDTDSAKFIEDERVVFPGDILGDYLNQWGVEQRYDFWQSVYPKQYKYHAVWDEKRGDCNRWVIKIKGATTRSLSQSDIESFDLYGTITYETLVSMRKAVRGYHGKRAGEWVTVEKNLSRTTKVIT